MPPLNPRAPDTPPDPPLRKTSRPYEVHAAPPGLVRAPGQPMDPGMPLDAAPATVAQIPPPPSRQEPLRRADAALAAPAKPLRSRHEAFCQYFVLYGNASVAARDAGYSGRSAKNQGYRLIRQPRIRARVADIRRGLAAAYGLDADILLGKLEAVYQRAVEDHHFHAATRAVEVQARIAGHVAGRGRLIARPPDDDQ